jgi:hypothetical protein
MKIFLAAQRFLNDDDVKEAVKKWLIFTSDHVLRGGDTENALIIVKTV